LSRLLIASHKNIRFFLIAETAPQVKGSFCSESDHRNFIGGNTLLSELVQDKSCEGLPVARRSYDWSSVVVNEPPVFANIPCKTYGVLDKTAAREPNEQSM
jgi:hypothetical protein